MGEAPLRPGRDATIKSFWEGCDSPFPWWCIIRIVIAFPGGSFQGPPQGSGPPQLGGPATAVRNGPNVVFGLVANTGVGAQISGWRFEADAGGEVERTSNTTSRLWGGKVVTSGTVSVTARWQNQDYALSRHISVTERPGWAYSVPSPTQVNSGYTGVLTVDEPPITSTVLLGVNQTEVPTQFNYSSITDQGPNYGYRFVTANAAPPIYRWVVSAPILNESSEFFSKQCGDFDRDTKPWGFTDRSFSGTMLYDMRVVKLKVTTIFGGRH